jgi:hypothetical protein
MTMAKRYKIPRYADSGVAFLGVELKDATILITSIFAGLIGGTSFGLGMMGYLGIPVAGYVLNRLLITLKSRHLPGAFRVWLFSYGLAKFGAVKGQKTLILGSNRTMNPAANAKRNALFIQASQSIAQNGYEKAPQWN